MKSYQQDIKQTAVGVILYVRMWIEIRQAVTAVIDWLGHPLCEDVD